MSPDLAFETGFQDYELYERASDFEVRGFKGKARMAWYPRFSKAWEKGEKMSETLFGHQACGSKRLISIPQPPPKVGGRLLVRRTRWLFLTKKNLIIWQKFLVEL